MGIPNKLSPMTGEEGMLPRGYLPAEFLEFGAKDKYVEITTPWTTAGAKVEVRSYERFYETNVGSNSEIGNGSSGNYFFWGAKSNKWHIGCGGYNTTTYDADTNWHNMRLVYASDGGCWVDDLKVRGCDFNANTKILRNFRLGTTTPTVNDIYYAAHTQVKTASLWVNGQLWRDVRAAIDLLGKPCMYDRVEKETFYNGTETAELTVGMTSLQALNLRKLPIVESGTLKVSLPWDAQWNIGVQNALSIAATSGWTITVQYRDPEVATANIPTSFLENSEFGRIDTGVLVGGDTVVECEFVPTTYHWVNLYYSAGTINTIPSFYGSYDYNKANGRRFTFGYGQNNLIRFDGYNGYPAYSSQLGVKYTTKHGGGKFYINGALIYEVPLEEFESTTNLSLLGHSWNSNQGVKNCRVYRFKFSRGAEKQGDWFPSIDSQGVPCFYDKVQEKSFYLTPITEGAILIAGFDTVAQARNLSKLPVVETGNLTVSLPWEAQWDAGTQAALQIATDRGWTITVQYRDPEVTTKNIPIGFLQTTGDQYIDTGLRRVDEKSYAAFVGEVHGEYPWSRRAFQTRGLAFSTETRTPPYAWWGSLPNGNDMAIFGMFERPANMPTGYIAPQYNVKIEYKKISINDEVFTSANMVEPSESETNDAVDSLKLFAYPNGVDYKSSWWIGTCRKFKAKCKNGTVDFVPALSINGQPCMYDHVTNQPFYNNGTGAFIAGFDTIEQARSLAYLPDVTAETDTAKKSLIVSLPWEAQLVITYVPAALQVAADRGWTITVQYRDPEADNVWYNKYATCTKQADMIAVNANYKADLTADGKWIYPLPKLSSGDQVFNGVSISEIAIEELPLASSGYFMFASNKAIKRFTTRMPVMNWFDRTFHNTSLEVFDYDGETFSPQVIQVGFNACKNFRTFNAVFGKKIVNANFAFSECILDKPSVLRIANSAIPSSSGQAFYIGIHIDLQNDTEVLDALALMETNGWVLTTQWNGIATDAAASVSTFGLRSPAIYAKLNTIEFSGGTTETLLDWGHYVTNWEERGYQEFASLEEAEEYFNINQTEEV